MRFSKPCLRHLDGAKALEGMAPGERAAALADFERRHAKTLTRPFVASLVASGSQLLRKKWLTIYVDSVDLLDFLENVELRGTDADALAKAARTLAAGEAYAQGLMLHLPKTQTSIFACFDREVLNVRAGAVAGWLHFADFENGDFKGCLAGCSAEAARVWRIVLNLLMYMDAFPECVRDGCPTLHSKGNRPVDYAKSWRIGASDAIRETYRNGTSPHMRRGHFRLLTSDRFKKKRGQTVYVKPTMVSGSAKTVTAP